jgi:hypothetical protein
MNCSPKRKENRLLPEQKLYEALTKSIKLKQQSRERMMKIDTFCCL